MKKQLCLLAMCLSTQAQIHQTDSSAIKTGTAAYETSHLVRNSRNTRLFNLNMHNSSGTVYLQIFDSYTAAIPGSATVSINTSTELCTIGTANATWTNGTPISFTSSTTLPAPLASNTTYYVTTMASTTTFKLSTTLDNALASTVLDLTTAGTGTITAHVLDGGPCCAPASTAANGTASYTCNVGRFFTNGIYAVESSANITYTAVTAGAWFEAVYSQ